MEGLSKTTEYLSWDSCCSNQDLNQVPSEYKSDEITTSVGLLG
jgi:hypothetical protein